ncbi:DAL5-Allantoate and ureidosuccinate permease [Fusarium tjaetaba]|uniref:DAL5-Allantoate and ureidosuccinate permease n=1 Tax=Fusarium tjaetaba TaxID=1567544 RepID=A0A8H5W315_9HYPO|nr:DAL5-Allantoate and ureidosuccinate permease [Fusarium tjaetaba]KAF5643458.1 DAL5-Allantoate and ureidosuccinate permease [Fusarium tjaetaba]
MDKDLKPVTTVPTNSTVGMGELVEDTASGRKPTDTLDDDEKHSVELGSPPLGLVYTSKEDARVRWKLDLILLPMMAFTYVLNYMDKVALSEASIFGIKEDLNLVGQQYSWSSSIFYLGYLVWQYPSSLLMQKLPIGRYFGAMIFLWGLTACTTAFTKDFATLCVNRVFLGVFESCMSPILTILISQYWTREEQPLRTSLWWSASAVGSFMADAITYGLSGKDHSGSKYTVWQVVYLVFGPMTMFWGIVVFFGVPASPLSAWFFSKRERDIATDRVLKNHTGIKNTEYKWNQVWECLMDPQPWLLAIHAFLQCLQGGGLTSFSKIVLTQTLGYSSRQATLMGMPSNTIHLVSVVFAGWFCTRFKNTRCYVMIATNIIVLIGAVLVDNLPQSNHQGRLASFYIIYVNTVPFGLGMSILSSNIAGFTKKSTASVMMFLGYCLGQFTGPQFFITHEAPQYQTAFRGFYSSVSAMIVLEIVLLVYIKYQNHRRGRREVQEICNANVDRDDLDLTDWQQGSFRDETEQVRSQTRRRGKRKNTSEEPNHAEISPQTQTTFSTVEADVTDSFEPSSLAMLDATAMPWMDGIFDSYPDQQWDLSPDAAAFSNATGQNWMPYTESPGQTSAGFTASSQASSSPQTVSDRVLAQHYTQNLASKYSSKGQTWNNHTYFFNRFNSSHSFVISALYAWTAAHLHCNGTLSSEASALEHYNKSLVALRDRLGIHLEFEGLDEDLGQAWPQLITRDDDLDAVSVTLYFLAWTDLLLSRRASLRRMVSLEACLLENRGHGDQSQSVYGRMAVWFCFLDARASLFSQGDDRIIQCLGNDLGLMFAVDKSYNFLQQEYTLLYPNEERRWDEAHRPLYGLATITEEKAAENKVLSIFLTANALFHAVHIYASRIYRSGDAIYAETRHAEEIIGITRRFYCKLKRPRTEAPPTKIWPIPLIMAAIEAKDPIYRDWALQLIKDCGQAGKHYANACVFVEKVHVAEEGTGCRANLSRIAQDMGDDFVI